MCAFIEYTCAITFFNVQMEGYIDFSKDQNIMVT